MTTDFDDFMEYEIRREFAKPRPFRCSDGLCGALDCSRCSPGAQSDEEEDDE